MILFIIKIECLNQAIIGRCNLGVNVGGTEDLPQKNSAKKCCTSYDGLPTFEQVID